MADVLLDANGEPNPVHYVGERNNTLHGNGAGSKDMERVSGDEDEVTCRLCHTLLAQRRVSDHVQCARCA